jgi:D-alanyl-D-alanine carboxypeptidase
MPALIVGRHWVLGMWRRSGGIYRQANGVRLADQKLPRVPVVFRSSALHADAFSAMQSASQAANPVLVFDVRTGKAIVARDAGKPWHPASLTKIMTAYLTLQAIEQGKLSLGTKLKVSEDLSLRRRPARSVSSPAHGSVSTSP